MDMTYLNGVNLRKAETHNDVLHLTMDHLVWVFSCYWVHIAIKRIIIINLDKLNIRY